MKNLNYLESTDYFGRAVTLDVAVDTEVNGESLPEREKPRVLVLTEDARKVGDVKSYPNLRHITQAIAGPTQVVMGDGSPGYVWKNIYSANTAGVKSAPVSKQLKLIPGLPILILYTTTSSLPTLYLSNETYMGTFASDKDGDLGICAITGEKKITTIVNSPAYDNKLSLSSTSEYINCTFDKTNYTFSLKKRTIRQTVVVDGTNKVTETDTTTDLYIQQIYVLTDIA